MGKTMGEENPQLMASGDVMASGEVVYLPRVLPEQVGACTSCS
jgi:hypothetical protein